MMQYYSKEDLLFKDYGWDITQPDSYKLKGPADRNGFINSQGNEVLYLINLFAEISGNTTKEDCSKMEQLLYHHCPIGKLSQVTVFRWMQETFGKNDGYPTV